MVASSDASGIGLMELTPTIYQRLGGEASVQQNDIRDVVSSVRAIRSDVVR
jgi:hypothetical protein